MWHGGMLILGTMNDGKKKEGTATIFARDENNNPILVTAGHTLGAPGSPVYAENPAGVTGPQIGKVRTSRWINDATIDFGIVDVGPYESFMPWLVSVGDNNGALLTGTGQRPTTLGEPLMVYGGKTGIHSMQVTNLSVSIRNKESGLTWYDVVTMVDTEAGNRPPLTWGDSGAPVVRDGRLVGIFVADDDENCLFVPAEVLFKTYGIRP